MERSVVLLTHQAQLETFLLEKTPSAPTIISTSSGSPLTRICGSSSFWTAEQVWLVTMRCLFHSLAAGINGCDREQTNCGALALLKSLILTCWLATLSPLMLDGIDLVTRSFYFRHQPCSTHRSTLSHADDSVPSAIRICAAFSYIRALIPNLRSDNASA